MPTCQIITLTAAFFIDILVAGTLNAPLVLSLASCTAMQQLYMPSNGAYLLGAGLLSLQATLWGAPAILPVIWLLPLWHLTAQVRRLCKLSGIMTISFGALAALMHYASITWAATGLLPTTACTVRLLCATMIASSLTLLSNKFRR